MDIMATKMDQQDEAIKRLEGIFEQMHQDTQLVLKNHSSYIHNLEVQMGQLTNSLSIRNQGTLPRNTEKNPMEYVKVITLRSEKEVQPPKGIMEYEEKKKEEKKE